MNKKLILNGNLQRKDPGYFQVFVSPSHFHDRRFLAFQRNGLFCFFTFAQKHLISFAAAAAEDDDDNDDNSDGDDDDDNDNGDVLHMHVRKKLC